MNSVTFLRGRWISNQVRRVDIVKEVRVVNHYHAGAIKIRTNLALAPVDGIKHLDDFPDDAVDVDVVGDVIRVT